MSAKPGLVEHPTPGKKSTSPEQASATPLSSYPSRQASVKVIVRARPGWGLPDFSEAWRYRELFLVLAVRDITLRYKRTALGIGWAIVQPLFTMFVLTAISRVAAISTDGVRPQVFYYCGMLPWLLFANSVLAAGNSLLSSQHLVTKIYFPRLIVPVASVIIVVIDFGIAFVVLLGMMLYYRVAPRPQIVLVPLFVALGVFAALGFGLWLCALTVRFRDLRLAGPFVTQLWFFCTPVLYSSTSAFGGWKAAVLGINPISSIVEGVRWCVLGRPVPGPLVVVATAEILIVLVSALFYFHQVEKTLADRL